MTPTNDATHPNKDAFPAGMSGPSLRALHNAGIRSMQGLTRWTQADLAALHGMGPKALGILESALAERGLALKA